MKEMELLNKSNDSTWFIFFETEEELKAYQRDCVLDNIEFLDFQLLVSELPYKQADTGDYIIPRDKLIKTLFEENDLNDLIEMFSVEAFSISDLIDHANLINCYPEDFIKEGYKYFIYLI